MESGAGVGARRGLAEQEKARGKARREGQKQKERAQTD